MVCFVKNKETGDKGGKEERKREEWKTEKWSRKRRISRQSKLKAKESEATVDKGDGKQGRWCKYQNISRLDFHQR